MRGRKAQLRRTALLYRAAILVAAIHVLAWPAASAAADVSALLREGHGHMAAQRWTAAEKPFQRVIAAQPGHKEALLGLGTVWWHQGKLDAAQGVLEQVLKRDPRNGVALYRRGQVLFDKGEYHRAELEFRRVLRIAPAMEPAWTRFYLGLALNGQSRASDTIFWLDAAFRKDANAIGANVNYYRSLALALMQERLYLRAEKVFEAGLKRFPEDLNLLHNAGRTQDALGDRKARRHYFDRATTVAYKRMTLAPRPVFDLPFRGRWIVARGHDTPPTHVGLQTYALDFSRVDSRGRSYYGSAKRNADFLGFGADILSPAVGTVISVVDNIQDNDPAAGSGSDVGPGNRVVIQHAGGIRSELSHLKRGSVTVRPGQLLQAGEKIGECGNSGYSLGPHLHISFSRKLDDAWVSIPVEFRNFALGRNGSTDSVVKGAPAAGDTVEPSS